MTDRLTIRDLSAGYRGAEIIRRLSLTPIKPGSVTALVGPNGSGKSTLLKAIAGLVAATGDVAFEGADVLGRSPAWRARNIAYLSQLGAARSGLLAVEYLLAGLRLSAGLTSSPVLQARVFGALSRLGISDLAFRTLDSLSGGQRQLVMLAGIIARQARLILLDEPTSALDLRAQLEVMSLIREFAAAGATVLVVLHDLTLATRSADWIVALDNGCLAAEGRPEDAVTPALLAKVYGVEAIVEQERTGGLRVLALGPLPHLPPPIAPSKDVS